MPTSPLFHISVFCDENRGLLGNVSAVALLENAPQDETVFSKIASDLNQPATTFLWPTPQKNHYYVRWFAPDAEIGLCGHGSLAAFAFLGMTVGQNTSFTLKYPNGEITGQASGDNRATLTTRALKTVKQLPVPPALQKALGQAVEAYYETENKHIVKLKNEEAVRTLQPDFCALKALEPFGYAVTAPGISADFVSRTLVPKVQQLEDHTTGSSHAALVPFWADLLGKDTFDALQLSPRGGRFQCTLEGHLVSLSGQYRVVQKGELHW